MIFWSSSLLSCPFDVVFWRLKYLFSDWQVGCPMRAPCPVGWDIPVRHASVTSPAQSPDVLPSNPASHFLSIPRSDSIEDQERQLYFKKHTIQQSCHPYVIFILLDLEMHSNSSKKPWWCLNMNLLMNCLFWGVQIDGFARHWKCVLSNQWPHYSISSCTMKNFDVAQSYERYTWSLVQYNHANHENERAHQWNCRLDYWLCLETFNVNCN